MAFEFQWAVGKESFMCRALRYAVRVCLAPIILIACEEIEILFPFRDHPSFSELSIRVLLTWKLRKVRRVSIIVCDCEVMKGARAHYLITRGLSACLVGKGLWHPKCWDRLPGPGSATSFPLHHSQRAHAPYGQPDQSHRTGRDY